MRCCILLVCAPLLAMIACGTDVPPAITHYGHTTSPDGVIEAHAYEHTTDAGELTQVMLAFPEACRSGAVAAYRVGLSLTLKWRDNENLEVHHPARIAFQRNASGEVLQCGKRKVRVHLVSSSQ